MNKTTPVTITCIVCAQERAQGIYICEQFMCQRCEQEIVNTHVVDDKYPFFIRQMKKIWLKENA